MATLCGAWGERESWQEMCPPIFLALYPGLFSSALVACSTANARGVKSWVQDFYISLTQCTSENWLSCMYNCMY